MNIKILNEFGADLRLRDSENMGPTKAEVKLAAEIERLRAERVSAGERELAEHQRAVDAEREIERLRAELAVCKSGTCHPAASEKLILQGAEIERLRAEVARKDLLLDDAEKVLIRQRKERLALRAERDALNTKYNELIMAVGNKYAGETRHQTALRYIIKAEEPVIMQAADAARKETP